MRLAAVTMQKNEDGLINHWLIYYASLCGGYEHLHIIDDASTSALVRQSLEDAASRGAHVYWDDDGKWRLEDKGRLASRIINDLAPGYDFYFPVDCDEFICLDEDGRPSLARDRICAELERSSPGRKALRIDTAFKNIPHSADVCRGETKKAVICGRGSAITLDTGFHLYNGRTKADTLPPGDLGTSRIAHVHFQYRPFLKAIAFAREKLKNRVPDFSRKRMENYTGGGFHLKPYFLISEDEYLAWFDHQPRIDISAEFAALGLDVPYSEPRPPLDLERWRQLLDPHNPAARRNT
jgi:hypothetical protein